MKKYKAMRRAIYAVEITGEGKDFSYAREIFLQFIAKFPEFAYYKYDSSYEKGVWTLRLYRECAIDFVE